MSSDAFRPLVLGLDWSTGRHGGSARYVQDLHRALRRSGDSVVTVVLADEPLSEEGVVVAGSHGEALPRRLLAYARAVRRHAPNADVVDAHFALYAFLPLLLGWLRGTPLVVHFHGPWADESAATGRVRGHRVRGWIERYVYRRASTLVVLSNAFAKVLREEYGIAADRIVVVSPGVDLDRFSLGDREQARAGLGVRGDAWVVATVRRLVPRMGIETLLEAWSLLPAEDRSELLVVGTGPERSALERRAAELGIADRVRFLGFVDDDALPDVYRSADLFVVPTTELEGFGLVVYEALACGTPVLASDVGGLPEALVDLGPGALVPPGDAQVLAARLAEVRERPDSICDRDAARRAVALRSADDASRRVRELLVSAAASGSRSEKPLIVFVDHCARLSGAELGLARLIELLDGYDRHVILAEYGPLVPRLHESGATVEVMPMPEATRRLTRDRVRLGRLPVRSFLEFALYVRRLRRRLIELDPDLVQTESLKAALYGGVAARTARLPLIWHIHDRIASDYLPAQAVRTFRLLARFVPHAIIANSQATLETIDSGRTAIIQYPISVSDEPYVPRRTSNDRFVATVVGRIAPWKGQDVFLRAFAEAFPDGPEQGLIVGAPLFGEDDFLEQLHELRHELGLDDRVEFTGFRSDVDAVLEGTDALVHASIIPEPFGQVVVQGLAAGVAVIAAGAGGPAEVIDDGITGLLYTPGDHKALAACLRRVAADPALRAEFGTRGREAAREYAPDRIVWKTKELYEWILSEHLGRR